MAQTLIYFLLALERFEFFNDLYNLPSSVPSSPIIIFIADIICIATGGDMEDAYTALWELPLMWSIISCGIIMQNSHLSN